MIIPSNLGEIHDRKKILNQGNLKVELPDDERIINYSNFAIVSHSPEKW